jgi:protein ImuB
MASVVEGKIMWLAAYYPDWLVQYLRYRHGLLAHIDGIALFDGRGLRILACDPCAFDLGVRPGQSLDTAQALAPALVLLPFDRAESHQANAWLCQWSYHFSARVVALQCSAAQRACQSLAAGGGFSLSGVSSAAFTLPDTLLLEVGSMARLFGGLTQLQAQYLQQADAFGLRVQLALAPNPLAAQLLARQALGEAHKGGSGRPKEGRRNKQSVTDNAAVPVPVPVVAGSKAEQQALLWTVSVDELPLDKETAQSLGQLGLHQLGALWRFPRAELGQRFGTGLLHLLASLDGTLPQVFDFYQLPETFDYKLSLLHEVDNLQGILFPLRRLFDALALYLRQRQCALLRLGISLEYRDKHLAPLVLELHYPFAEYQADRLLALCRLQLENLRHQALSQSVVALALCAREFVAMEARPESWFGQRQHRTQLLLGQLQARLGAERLLRVTSVPALLPEERSRQMSLSTWGQKPGQGPAEAGLDVKARVDALIQCLPGWLLATPQAISPAQLVLLKGPERIRAPWWQTDPREDRVHGLCDRDYYLAQTHDGRLCWVFKTVSGLYLHGWFA